MKCFLQLYCANVQDEDGPEWTRKLRDGIAVDLCEKDFPLYSDQGFHEFQSQSHDDTTFLHFVINYMKSCLL